MTYQETLHFLYSQLPMFQRVGTAAFKKDLTNTKALCSVLGNPERKFLSIHIAGTNGKGSVSHFLAAILQAAGLKTGLYISPHYKDFRERIKINGAYIPRRRVVDFVEKNQETIAAVKPSYFEMCVAMAFDHFAREAVDVAVIETGLGGRLDSTNVLRPVLSIITNISYDHQNMLGDTLPEIAGEKAGIIKAHTPVLIGERQAEVQAVFEEKAQREKATITWADTLIGLTELSDVPLGKLRFLVEKQGKTWLPDLILDSAGPFQAANLRTTLAAVVLLQKHKPFAKPISDVHILNGLLDLRARTRYIGRWQLLGTEPTILCDSAHNEAGIRTLVAFLEKTDYQKLHFVFGTVSDKDPSKTLKKLPSDAKYYFAKANIPRGLDAVELARDAQKLGLNGKPYTSVRRALAAAKKSANAEDLIVVAGSIFVVAEVL